MSTEESYIYRQRQIKLFVEAEKRFALIEVFSLLEMEKYVIQNIFTKTNDIVATIHEFPLFRHRILWVSFKRQCLWIEKFTGSRFLQFISRSTRLRDKQSN